MNNPVPGINDSDESQDETERPQEETKRAQQGNMTIGSLFIMVMIV